MITNTPLQFSVLWASILSWINISSPLILFGLYYGFLTTLPIGPSQIISIRAFLLEGNLSGTVAISGLILGQLLIFLSIYYSPLYIILVKPHTITLLVLPYILFYWYRIKDLLDYQSLRPINSINDSRIYKIFFDSFFFQLLNPVLLPSPVLARLINLFLFRYSNNFLFVVSCFFGWLSGHFFFFKFINFFSIRIEKDSPVLYLLVKRLIYRTFSIIILVCFLLYLGKAPVPLFTKKLNDEFQFSQLKNSGFSWLNKPWPIFFFDHRRWNRPARYVENSRFSNKSTVKKNVSQYFFDISLSDGKQKISFTALPSLSIFEKDLKNYLNISKESTLSSHFYNNWITSKQNRKNNLYYELKSRLKALDSGIFVKDIIEKKTSLFNNEGNNLTKLNDPFLTGSYRGKTTISKSPWLLIDNFNELKKNRKTPYLLKKENKLKFWISNRWRDLERKNLPLPWESLSKDARRVLILFIQGSKNKKLKTKLQQIKLSDEQLFINSTKQNFFSELDQNLDNKLFLNRKQKKKSYFNWEFVLNLSTRQKALYFKQLEEEKRQILERSWKNLFLNNSINFIQLNKSIFLLKKIFHFHKKFRLQEISKEIPRWTSKLRNDKFDVIAVGVTDIRQRKVKNLGYLIKGKDKRRKIVRRFSQQSDFRRKLVKGSMRARRRKTLIWKVLQLKTHSPFFLRINEKHIPFQFSLNKFHLLSIKNIFKNPIEKQKKISFFSTKKNTSIKKTKADRLAIANRWDFPLAQWGRSWLLIIQSYFRKYLILPILIISKNIIRLILFQTPEWGEDWNDWNKEIYIKCTYDGTEVSEKELPEQWLRDGLQIKIIYPFSLKPWHNLQLKKNKHKKKKIINSKSLNSEKENLNRLLNNNKDFIKNKKKINYSYLTAWGFETNSPFGDIKKKPYFWKPIRKKLTKKWKKNILLKLNKIYSIFFLIKKKFTINSIKNELISDQSNNLIKLDPKLSNNYKTYLNNKSSKKSLPEQISPKFNKNFLSENQIKTKYEISRNIKKLEKLKYLKKNKIEKITKKFSFDNKKKTIKIKQKLLKYCKKKFELIKKWPYLIKKILNEINKKNFQFFLFFMRFNSTLIIKIKQNFTFIKNKKIINSSKISQFNLKKNTISYEYSSNFNKKNIFLISQTYLFYKVWQKEIITKYNLKTLLKFWTSNLIVKKVIKKKLKKKGLFSLIELKTLKEKNWKKWLQNFNKYNISSQEWCKITPKKWRNQVTYHWKKKKLKQFLILEKQKQTLIVSKQKEFSYKLVTNSLLHQNKKLKKRYKYHYFCYSYLDFKKYQNFIKLVHNKKKYIINNTFLQTVKNKKNIFIKPNLTLWLIPTLTEKKYITKIEKLAIPKISLLKQKTSKTSQNKKSLRERERHQTIRQWKWKSKNVEKNFKELGDMASLMTFMQDQKNAISLSKKMRENLKLFRLLFCRDIGINKLTINSEHRLPRVLDDQILMYKVVSLFLKSKKRFKNNSYFQNLNEYTSRIEIFQNQQNKKLALVNIEDIILPKYRKELKVLNLLDLNKNKTLNLRKDFLNERKNTQIKLQKLQEQNKNLTIKHFLWPSFRLEDLACINRFWFNTTNGSRFSMLRIRMYT